MAQRLRVERLEDRLAPAAPTQFLQRGVGGGVYFDPSLSPHDANDAYLLTDMSQVYRTKNFGLSWDYYDFREYAVNNRVNGVHYTGDPMTLFGIHLSGSGNPKPIRSTDGGVTWQKAGAAGFASNWPGSEAAWRIYTDIHRTGRVLVNTQGRLYYSSDGGQTFGVAYTYSQAPNLATGVGLYVSGVFFDPTDATRVWAATNDGLLLSTNGGATFASAGIGGIPSGETLFAFAAAQESGVTRFYAITVTGTVAVPVSTALALPFSSYAHTYKLDWGQANWSLAPTSGLDATAGLLYLAMNPGDIDTVYAAGQYTGKMYVSKFTSQTGQWGQVFLTSSPATTNVTNGYVGPGAVLAYSSTVLGIAVSPLDPNRLVLADGWTMYSSTNGGSSWRQMSLDPAEEHAPGVPIPRSDTYHNTGANNCTVWWIEWTSANNMFVAFDDITAMRSTDGGQTFSWNFTGLSPENFVVRKHPATGVLYLAQGKCWPPNTTLGLSDSKVDPYTGSVRFSTDAGQSWQVLEDLGHPVTWISLDPNDPNTIYASVNHSTLGGIFVSHNIQLGTAATFTKLASQPPRTEGRPLTTVALADGTLVATFTGRRNDATGKMTPSSGVFVLPAGSTTWIDRSMPEMQYWTKELYVDPHDPNQNTWYVGVGDAFPPVSDVSITANGGGLYETRDRGVSWTRLLSNDTESVAFHPTDPNEMYVATTNDGLWITNNRLALDANGLPAPTLTQLDSYTHRRPARVFYNPYDPAEVWVAGNGGGLSVGRAGQVAGTFSLSTGSVSVIEGAPVNLSVTRTGDLANAMTVDYLVSPGTAGPTDYLSSLNPVGVTGTLTFRPGQATVNIAIPTVDDSAIEGSESFTVSLLHASSGQSLGAMSSAKVTLTDNDPATITAVTIGDGSTQRSRITQLSVTFSEPVTFPGGAAAAFLIHRTGPGATIGDIGFQAQVNGNTVTLLPDNSGLSLDAGSLPDGNYTWTIVGSQIAGLSGPIDADGDGLPAGDRIVLLHRLFGDVDGDRTVTNVDFLAFRLSLLSNNPAFDADGDGQVNATDFLQFRLRFLQTI
ncbi:MAG: hypothetical protein K1X57_10825 [Gemmataceae bacterium]|nr:hypothetical protein [Gemmataceae bacterium]